VPTPFSASALLRIEPSTLAAAAAKAIATIEKGMAGSFCRQHCKALEQLSVHLT